MSLHFIRPEWFIALLPLLLVLWSKLKHQGEHSQWDKYIAPHLANVLISKGDQQRRHWLPLVTSCWLLAVLALSGPALFKKPLPVFASTQGRVIVMDMSLSMYATDLTPNRLTQARFRVTDLLKGLKEGETGLIAYAGDAFVISPLTRDSNTLLNLLPTLSPDIMPVMGSNLPAALTKAKELLSQGGHIKGDIILVTDGVETAQLNAAKAVLQDTHYRLGVLALGSTQGAPVRLSDGQLMRDSSNQVVVPGTNYGQLNELAQSCHGSLIPFANDGSDLIKLRQWLSTDEDAQATHLAGDSWIDLGPYLALLLLLPMLAMFRYGLPVWLLVLPLCGSLLTSKAQADTWDNLWHTRDQQGMQAFKQQDFKAAADKFANPAWQGSALYRAGDYQGALKAFEQDKSANGYFNQGNALMQMGEYDEAIKRYNEALKKEPDMKDAQTNLKIAKEQEKQKKNKQKQNNNNQSGNQKQQDTDKQNKNNDQADQRDKKEGDNSEQNKPEQQQSPQDQQQNSGKDNQGSQQPQQGDKSANKQEQQQASQGEDSAAKDKASSKSSATDNKQQEQTAADKSSAANQQQAAASDSAPQNAQPAPQMQADASQDNQTDAAKQQANASAAKTADKPAPQNPQNGAVAASSLDNQDKLPADMQRALKAVVDDPAALLRNKMQLEYQKRRQNGDIPKEQQQW